tara:strand:- start:4190 stop:4432 length:243 start_codon:yes stop_codon:yes gene_type:complete
MSLFLFGLGGGPTIPVDQSSFVRVQLQGQISTGVEVPASNITSSLELVDDGLVVESEIASSFLVDAEISDNIITVGVDVD